MLHAMKRSIPFASAWLQPDWPTIAGVHAIFTTRTGGVSTPPWDSMNLGDHVGDDPRDVASNRALFAKALAQVGKCDVQPQFLHQVHGVQVAQLPLPATAGRSFDASITTESGQACTIMVADCLPILIAHRHLGIVGAAHAGWRGLAGTAGVGVVEQLWHVYCRLANQRNGGSVAEIAAQTQIWLGPCIGPQAFEVGAEVLAAFTAGAPQAQRCFTPGDAAQKWRADLSALARQRWQALGVRHLYGNDSSPPWCTVGNPLRFFSHRRDAREGGRTGRMAVAIWRTGA